MKRTSLITVVFLASTIFIACTSTAEQVPQEILTLQYTFSAQPWLEELNACAGQVAVFAEQRSFEYMDISSFDMAMRIGDSNISSPAYQIATEDLVVIVNPENPVGQLSASEIRLLFTGITQNWESISGQDAPIQVWVYPSGEDIQQAFEQIALSASPITTEALLASNPAQMLEAVAVDENAVGIITRSFLSDQVSEAYTVASLPVLMLLLAEPPAAALAITACLQK